MVSLHHGCSTLGLSVLGIYTTELICFHKAILLAANALLTLHVYTRLANQSAYTFRAAPLGQIDITPGQKQGRLCQYAPLSQKLV